MGNTTGAFLLLAPHSPSPSGSVLLMPTPQPNFLAIFLAALYAQPASESFSIFLAALLRIKTLTPALQTKSFRLSYIHASLQLRFFHANLHDQSSLRFSRQS